MEKDSDEDSTDLSEIRPVSIDKFGFIISEEYNNHLSPIERKKLHEKEGLRAKKWIKMLNNWEKTLLHKESKLKSRIRKGIPDIVRGEVWKRIANVDNMKRLYPNAYHDGDVNSEIPESTSRQIEVDLNRTFPKHDFFVSYNGAGQASLRKLLQLYAVFDPEVGYCSGMGFVAATLVMYMSEEDALYAFIAMMSRGPFPLREMYLPGMPGARYTISIFVDLMHHYLPAISAHLDQEGITPHMYVTEWFMTLYTSSFPFELVMVIFDILWYEGWKIIYRVGLALIKYLEPSISSSGLEDILLQLRALPQNVNCQKLWKIVWEIPLKTQVIETYASRHPHHPRLGTPGGDMISTALDSSIQPSQTDENGS